MAKDIDEIYDYTNIMVNAIRNGKSNISESDEKGNNDNEDSVIIDNIPSFSNTINGWEGNIRDNLRSNLNFESFIYYPKNNDIIANYSILDIGAKVQMRLNDPSGNGLYIWVNGLQLNDTNMPKIQHIKTAYENWRNGLIKDNSVINDLQNLSKKG